MCLLQRAKFEAEEAAKCNLFISLGSDVIFELAVNIIILRPNTLSYVQPCHDVELNVPITCIQQHDGNNTFEVASFPGSPRARTKSGKERGEPGKIYHVRNVIGRENLITCGRTNEHAHALLTIYSFSRESFIG